MTFEIVEQTTPGTPWPRTEATPRKGDAHENLVKASDLFLMKNKFYGDGYKDIGAVLGALFPMGLSLRDDAEFGRFATFVMCATKLQRYAAQFAEGGHEDSAKDLTVYSAMLQELTK